MNADPSRVLLIEGFCDCCGTANIQLRHAGFPELTITTGSVAEAGERLIQRLDIAVEAVSEPSQREPIGLAIADVRAFLLREQALHSVQGR